MAMKTRQHEMKKHPHEIFIECIKSEQMSGIVLMLATLISLYMPISPTVPGIRHSGTAPSGLRGVVSPCN